MKKKWIVGLIILLPLMLWATTSGQITLNSGTTPGNPSSGKFRLWANSSSGRVECINSSGNSCFVVNLAGGANEVTGLLPCANLPVGAQCLLSEQVLGGTAATVTFSAIPGTYRNLRLVFQARCNDAATAQGAFLQFNGDTAANYSRQFLSVQNTSITGAQTISNSQGATVAFISCAGALANTSGTNVIDILNYSGTTFFKTAFGNSGAIDSATASGIRFFSFYGLWANTSAITSILITPSAGSFIAGSVFDLYAQ